MKSSSTQCNACTDRSGELNPNWKSGTSIHKAGYVMRRVDGQYIFEHILVMEEHLGRKLLEGENVHHINGVKDDNRIANLELWTRPQPSGIRAKDALAHARKVINQYGTLEHLL